MTQAAKAQEPSMEEILASIRRIISDDDATKSVMPPASSAAVPEPRPSTVASIPSRSRQFPPRSAAVAPALTSRPDANEHSHLGVTSAEFNAPSTEASSESLLSSKTRAAIDSAFKPLTSAVSGQNAPTLEDLVKDMLRPMLKSWLDDNLPGLVERIVRSEVERISRGHEF